MPYKILYSDELVHHGVQGQQWGVQNGPPYPLDKSISTGSKLRMKRASVKKTAKETAKKFKSMNMVTENADPWHNNRDERAAITGIKALIETYGKVFEEVDPENKDDQFWFLIEDQTVGLGSISDLANQGKTKSEIKELINNADILRNNGYEDIPGVFQLYWASRYPKIDEYISKCVEIANDNEVKHFCSNDYLIHHGVQGQQWGIQNGPPYPLDRSISTGSRLKKEIDKRAGRYLNAPRSDIKSGKAKKRQSVSDQYARDYEKLIKTYGINTGDRDGTEASQDLEKASEIKYLDSILWNSFYEKYVDATISDLKLNNDDETKKYIKKHFDKDLLYVYDVVDTSTNRKLYEGTFDKYTADAYSKYERYRKVMNPRLPK